MSTKIYDAYMLPNSSAYELGKIVNSVRPNIIKEAKRQFAEKMAEDIAFIFDSITLDKKFGETLIKFYSVEKCKMLDRREMHLMQFVEETIIYKCKEIKKTGHRNPFYDFSFELCVFPLISKTLIMLFCDNRELKEVFHNDKRFTYYGYWDNTDMEDGVTEREWRQRKKDWNKALGENSVPSEQGFIVDMVDMRNIAYNCLTKEAKEEIIKNMPSFSKRIKRHAFTNAMAHELKTRKQETTDNNVNFWIKIDNYLRVEPEGKQKVKEEAERLKKILKPRFCVKDLMMRVRLQPDEVEIKTEETITVN